MGRRAASCRHAVGINALSTSDTSVHDPSHSATCHLLCPDQHSHYHMKPLAPVLLGTDCDRRFRSAARGDTSTKVFFTTKPSLDNAVGRIKSESSESNLSRAGTLESSSSVRPVGEDPEEETRLRVSRSSSAAAVLLKVQSVSLSSQPALSTGEPATVVPASQAAVGLWSPHAAFSVPKMLSSLKAAGLPGIEGGSAGTEQAAPACTSHGQGQSL
mmetsp:Transcript_133359/g.345129  ORF Transcript_133359/g.345129 Transcript_133359/m.345129 type:complete len:215 (-) Transcript_133359:1275-1919(-)